MKFFDLFAILSPKLLNAINGNSLLANSTCSRNFAANEIPFILGIHISIKPISNFVKRVKCKASSPLLKTYGFIPHFVTIPVKLILLCKLSSTISTLALFNTLSDISSEIILSEHSIVGNTNENFEPVFTLLESNQIKPPINSTSSLLIANPNPVP